MDDRLSRFFEQHHVRDNMFDSFEAAQTFFQTAGFVIDKEAVIDHSKLSALPNLLQNLSEEELKNVTARGKIRATWRLGPTLY